MKKQILIFVFTIASLLSFGQTVQLTNLTYSSTGQPINGPIEIVSGQSVNINYTVNYNTSGTINNSEIRIGIRWPNSFVINQTLQLITVNPQTSGSQNYFNISLNSNQIPVGSTLTVSMFITPGSQTLWGNAININIVPPPPPIQNNTISGNQNIAFGQTPTALIGSVPTGGSGSYTYQWQAKTAVHDWINVSDGNSKNYQPVAPYLATEFRRRVMSPNISSSLSNIVTVTVSNNTNTIGSDQTINYGETPDLLTGNSYFCDIKPCYEATYRWFRSPIFPNIFSPVEGDSNSPNYQPPSLNSSTRYRRRMIVNGVISHSNQVTIIVNNNLRISDIGTIDEFKNNIYPDIKLYPNPLINESYINFHIKKQPFENNQNVSLVVFSLNGESLIKKEFLIKNNEIKEKIELSNLDSGVYLFKFIINNIIYNYTIVKK